jgi:hypothetical protein
MSVQKVSRKQFAGFFNRLCKMLGGNVKRTGHLYATAVAMRSIKSSAGTVRDRRSNGVTSVDLDRYYATPGQAEWGC